MEMKYLLIIPIKIYQKVLSPILGSNCRFQPTCSAYSLEAVEKYGFFKGGSLAIKRIFSCHPWGKTGYDPVP